jgi:VWFA-related protein
MCVGRREFLSALAAAPLLRSQDETPLFRTGVSVVRVDAKVTDAGGADISGLESSDFVVLDEGQPQKVLDFSREAEGIDVVLVLDVSPSMRELLSVMAAKSGEALDRLRSGDRVGVLAFAARTEWIQPLTSDLKPIPQKIIRSIFKDTLGRTTFVNEALVEAVRGFGDDRSKRKRTIIVITDDAVVRDQVKDEDVVRELHGTDAVLNAILLAEPKTRGAVMPVRYRDPAAGRVSILRYAEATGGDAVTGERPELALEKLLQAALTRYSLQYASPGGEPGTFRRITVELTPEALRSHPGARIQARSGYQVE